MNSESVKNYTRRITSANKSEIIVIIYDIIEENLALAKEASDKGNKEEFKAAIKKGLAFVKELVTSLDMSYEVSENLLSLYIYVMRCLNFALASSKKEEIEAAETVITKLGEAFKEVAKTDDSKPVMANTQRLYAGLTYGKGLNLDETAVSENSANRGYRV